MTTLEQLVEENRVAREAALQEARKAEEALQEAAEVLKNASRDLKKLREEVEG